MSDLLIEPEALQAWAVAILIAAGASPRAAEATARSLVFADRRGVDLHGIVFLRFYLPRLRAGASDGAAHPRVLVDMPALALIDGRRALGAYVASFAMSLCCDKAEAVGAAAVAVRNSGHFGAASYYADMAAERGYAGIALSNSDPGMAPLGALGPLLGTNPLAISAPRAPGLPTPSLDIATSVVAQGKIILASRAGTQIPGDWAIGPDGHPTDDPDAALAGAVLPMAGHKGFALAFMIDVLTACLSGALVSPEIPAAPDPSTPEGTGHLFIAIKVDALGPRAAYESALSKLASAVHQGKRADWAEPFMMPGEREAKVAAERLSVIRITSRVSNCCKGWARNTASPFKGHGSRRGKPAAAGGHH